MESQAAVEESGRFYDKLTIKLATGSKVDVWFDLTQARAGWGTAAIESLGEVPASQSAGSSDALLSAAKRVIQECLAKLSGTQRIPEQDSFLPGEEAIGTIMKTAYDMKLKATLNKPSKFPARTRKTPFFGFCGLLRRPFGPFAGP